MGLFAIYSGHICLYGQNNLNEQLAIQYFKANKFDEAVSLFADIYQNRPDNYYYSYYLKCLMETENFKEAEKLIAKQQKREPKIQRYQVDLGMVYEKEGNINKAKKQYEHSIYNYPHNDISLRELSAAFMSYGLKDYAINCYHRIREITNNPGLYACELADLYARKGEYEKSLQEYFYWITEKEENVEILETELTTWMAKDENNQKKELIRRTLLKYINKYPDYPCYSRLMLWLSMQEKDYEFAIRQAIAMDKRFKEEGKIIYLVANIAKEHKKYKDALAGYNYILDNYSEFSLYHESALAGKLNTQYLEINEIYPPVMSEIKQLNADLDSFFNKHSLQESNLDIFLNRIEIQSVYLKNKASAKELLESAIQKSALSSRAKAICKLKLGDVYKLENNLWEASLLYSQVEKDFPNDTLGQNAKFKNAKLAFYMGEFEWSKAQLDVLRAATSKLIANDAMYLSLIIFDNEGEDSINLPLIYYAKADYLFECKEYEKAEKVLDSVNLLGLEHELNDDILYRKAEISIKIQKYEDAKKYLSEIISNYSQELIADDAIFTLARLYENQLNDPLTAMDLYQKLIKEYPDSIFTEESRKHFRQLRSGQS